MNNIIEVISIINLFCFLDSINVFSIVNIFWLVSWKLIYLNLRIFESFVDLLLLKIAKHMLI